MNKVIDIKTRKPVEEKTEKKKVSYTPSKQELVSLGFSQIAVNSVGLSSILREKEEFNNPDFLFEVIKTINDLVEAVKDNEDITFE